MAKYKNYHPQKQTIYIFWTLIEYFYQILQNNKKKRTQNENENEMFDI